MRIRQHYRTLQQRGKTAKSGQKGHFMVMTGSEIQMKCLVTYGFIHSNSITRAV